MNNLKDRIFGTEKRISRTVSFLMLLAIAALYFLVQTYLLHLRLKDLHIAEHEKSSEYRSLFAVKQSHQLFILQLITQFETLINIEKYTKWSKEYNKLLVDRKKIYKLLGEKKDALDVIVRPDGKVFYKDGEEFNIFWKRIDHKIFPIYFTELRNDISGDMNYFELFEEWNNNPNIKTFGKYKVQVVSKESILKLQAFRQSLSALDYRLFFMEGLTFEALSLDRLVSSHVDSKISRMFESFRKERDDLELINIQAKFLDREMIHHILPKQSKEQIKQSYDESLGFGNIKIPTFLIVYAYPFFLVCVFHWILLNLKILNSHYACVDSPETIYSSLYMLNRNKLGLFTTCIVLIIPIIFCYLICYSVVNYYPDIITKFNLPISYSELEIAQIVSVAGLGLSTFYLWHIAKTFRSLIAKQYIK
ncbi:hypothetical protein ACQV5M_07835 [Leptospira sp. SA-E8]|uniref:hypothetical protein n=1 Tax=Leptospira sp. SA-E8 TaxID=3422259 RepID=UPI003EB8F8FF